MCGKSAYCWKTRFTGRRFAGTVVTSLPWSTIRPSSGTSKPAIIRSVVVFPQPLGPSIEKNSPSSIVKPIESPAFAVPKCFVTSSSAIAAGIGASAAFHPEPPLRADPVDAVEVDHDRDAPPLRVRLLLALGRPVVHEL